MELNSKQVLNIRKKLRWVFIAAITVAATMYVVTNFFWSLESGENNYVGPPEGRLTVAQLLGVASLFTSAITGLGLIISNAIAWKKELRERENFELDAEKKRLEIEKLKRELDTLREKDGNSAALPSRRND